ncbi:SusC/RagA family TonB-linked outer membrane protein [Pontibacter pudoricolor]|uniref:SusC/RagA family TonB-linked outer membrane protein n=1 Tax=Pontibacter pudoricolor TaxID=2694930 RepID=UPI001391DB2E|nr:SusC/RagA family TonB-linked outer membrane protein [Pontibacter pudoricolor]
MKQTLRTAGAILSLLLISVPTIAQESDSTKHVHSVQGINIRHIIEASYSKKDVAELTEHIPATSLNKGLITTPEQFISSQFTGLQVVQGNGKPGSGSQLIIRNGGATVFGSNAPIIVLDGVPFEEKYVFGHTGALSFLNPEDIASVTLLKDAASNTIYGARATNGVLYISTKGGQTNSRPKVTYKTTAAVSVLRKKAEILDIDQLRDLVKKEYPNKVGLLGDENTDWQDVIYREAFSHDHNLGVSGTAFDFMPYRVSAGYLTQNGILETSQHKCTSLALALNPRFFKDHLRLNLNVRKVDQDVRVANQKAIVSSWAFDPTQPVYQQNNYGNYFAYLNEDGTADVYAPYNPLSLLEQYRGIDETNSFMGQAHLQYKLHFFPQLSLNARYSLREQENDFSAFEPKDMVAVSSIKGRLQTHNAAIKWEQREAFLSLDQPLNFIQSKVALTIGARSRKSEFEHRTHVVYDPEGDKGTISYSFTNQQAEFTSFFGDAGISVKDRYFLNGALTQEKYPVFAGDEKGTVTWGVGAAWNLSKESFMAGFPKVSELRLYGNYSHYVKPDLSAYQFSKNAPKYENTSKWNTGLNWRIFENRLSGDVNYFQTKTQDLFNYVYQASAGGDFRNYINGGSLSSKGLEATINYSLISTDNFKWSVGGNMSHSITKVNSLYEQVRNLRYGPEGEVMLSMYVGNPVGSFNVSGQVYDEAGKPIEGKYTSDRIAMGQKDPKWMFGLHSDLNYKKFSASLLLRAATGHQVFNMADASRGALGWVWGPNYLENITRSYYDTGFEYTQRTSSYYLEDASFLRLEYLQVGYQVGSVWKDRANLNLTATVQNAFVLTKYSGQDPEVAGGIDYGQYPQPTTFSLGLKLEI